MNQSVAMKAKVSIARMNRPFGTQGISQHVLISGTMNLSGLIWSGSRTSCLRGTITDAE